MDLLTISNGSFALDLFKKLNESSKGENIFFSPWSISTGLAMVYLGARGNTATEMAEVLHFNKEEKSVVSPQSSNPSRGRPRKRKMEPEQDETREIHVGFKTLLSAINKPNKNYELKTANRLYEEKTFPLIQRYLQLAKKFYCAEPQAVNFRTAAEQARKEINSWVTNQTEGTIQDLLPTGSVDSRTALVLVNAIYFKGKWEKQFIKENTFERPFRVSKTKTKPVQMMFLKDMFKILCMDTMKLKIIELPYIKNELSMFILLPDDISDSATGLELLERELTYEKLAEWTSPDRMAKVEVEMYLPRIQLEEGYDLKLTLSSMGMPDAFSPGQADFTGLSVKKDLFLSKIFHKSFVEVNEEGTEAAAATGIVIAERAHLKAIKFKADHPFLFFIRHNKTKSILFFGKFCSP
ncbi:heterochromatin-associated protein MENT-like isoform X1 [Alligator sinensis]|uniref:Serpin B10 n=2 Tax=Alligator sinensis TaxID=38654 RepID=A0A1U7RW80_ALLSI|nr:heterochromatin-associated protein MENT-like isoform X1 [Alligator sinensis]XP_025061511.1 heterochromatin-associated protein MENT-like isoform X1 [Alligator sinensis]